MAELWDLLDDKRCPTGQLLQRGDELPEGCRHLVVEVLVLCQGRLLTTLRHPKKHNGSFWEVTAGSALSGENSRTAAARELYEETGIAATPQTLELFDSIETERIFSDTYLLCLDSFPGIRLQDVETVNYAWLTMAEMADRCEKGLVIPHLAMRFPVYRTRLEALITVPAGNLDGEEAPACPPQMTQE